MILKSRRLLFLLLALTILVTVLACSNSPPAPQLSADEIKTKSSEAAAKIESYRFDMDMSMTMSGGTSAEIVQQSGIEGMLDKSNKKMWTDISTYMKMTASSSSVAPAEMRQEAEIYIVGNQMYVKEIGQDVPSDWQQQEVTDEVWSEQDTISQQMKMLEASQVTLAGQETIDGVDSYILEVTPDTDQIWDVLKQQLGEEGLPQTSDTKNAIDKISIRTWIAKDTFFPMKVEQEIRMVMNSADLQDQQLGQNVDITIELKLDLLAHDYNQAMSIELPPELQ